LLATFHHVATYNNNNNNNNNNIVVFDFYPLFILCINTQRGCHTLKFSWLLPKLKTLEGKKDRGVGTLVTKLGEMRFIRWPYWIYKWKKNGRNAIVKVITGVLSTGKYLRTFRRNVVPWSSVSVLH